MQDYNHIEYKKKVGRPRKKGVMRESNGRVSRAKRDQIFVALSARAKHMGISLSEAADYCTGTYLGRLCYLGNKNGITQSQYDAAVKFLFLLNDYKKTLLSVNAHYEYRSLSFKNLTPSEIDDRYTEWCQKIQKLFDQVMDLIKKQKNPNLLAALNHIVIADQWVPSLLPDLRILCDLLEDFFIRNH